jgi:hypothetical protein
MAIKNILIFIALLPLLASCAIEANLDKKSEIEPPSFMKIYDWPASTKFYKNHIWIADQDFYFVKLFDTYNFKGLALGKGTILTKAPKGDGWAVISDQEIAFNGNKIPPKTPICIYPDGKISPSDKGHGCDFRNLK